MISGFYSAATAMDSSMRRHEVASENLANSQMPGFRQRMVFNEEFQKQLGHQSSGSAGSAASMLGTSIGPIVFNFEQGPLQNTSKPLDLALNGEGFFTVQGPEGPLFTRNGSFYIDQNRQLTTIDMLPVMGTNGPIVLPENVTAESVTVSNEGHLIGGGREFGQLALVDFPDKTGLSGEGASLFSADPDTKQSPARAQVLQGHLELSNTSSIDEMITLIECTRHIDAAQKAMQTLSESVQKRIGLR